MSAAAEWIDAAIQREATWERADAARERFGAAIGAYGASVGSVRAAVRDYSRGHALVTHDDITVLSSELWAVPVYERRLAAIVLLQTHLAALHNGDLTRLEGFVRSASVPDLLDPLVDEVITPLIRSLEPAARVRADAVVERWRVDPDPAIRRAGQLVTSPEPVRDRAARSDDDR